MNTKTQRLYLKTFTEDDITSEYINGLNDPEVVQYTTLKSKHWTEENVRHYVVESNNNKSMELIGIFIQDIQKHIGNIRLHFDPTHKHAAFSIMIWDKLQWNKGYGTEALEAITQYVFNNQGYHKFFCDYYIENPAYIKMLKKCGFEIDGILRKHHLLNGKFVDKVYMAKFNHTLKI